MRANGLAWSLAIVLAFVGLGRAAEEVTAPDKAETVGSPNASEHPTVSDEAAEPPMCEHESEPWTSSDGWYECWIGSTCAYHLYGGTEITFLNVDSKTGGRITESFSDTTAPGVATVAFRESDGVDDRAYAPRVWLGAQLTDKWSVRGRFWRLDDADQHFPELNSAIPQVGTNFGTFEMTDHTEAFTTDVEAVRNFEWNCWKAEAFVGGRHAELETDSNLLAFGVFTTGNFVNLTLQNGCDFNGNGVTYGGTLRRALFGSHWSAFGTVRGSALDGETDSFARADGTVASSPSAPLVGAATVRRNNGDARLYIFELQTGLEFECPLANFPASFFFRTAYEFQKWDVDGLPTGGAGFGGTIGEITTNSFSSADARGAGMILHGISLGTGLTW